MELFTNPYYGAVYFYIAVAVVLFGAFIAGQIKHYFRKDK
jgi:hypothetical protein